jgi:PAS domain S-box-containing protein
MEQALAISVLDAIPTPIFVKDERLNFVFANRAHCALIGKRFEDIIGKSDAAFFPEEESSLYISRDQMVLDTGKLHLSEESPTAANGNHVPVMTRKARLKLEDGRSFLVGTVTDLTELQSLKLQNEEIMRLNLQLQENMARLADAQAELLKKGKLEQLGQLTATIAHELRNPLGAVKTSAFLLERKLGDGAASVSAQLERISNGIARCDNIITQLLDFARTRKIEPIPEVLDRWLEALVREEVTKLTESVDVSLSLDTQNQSYLFDPSRLSRALINLISNAVEAFRPALVECADSSTEHCAITVRTFRRGNDLVIQVEDNGPGIQPEILEKIREPLFTTKNFGTGLGVPAVEQIAMQHGGGLEISSVVGKGSVFSILIPCMPATRSDGDDNSASTVAA